VSCFLLDHGVVPAAAAIKAKKIEVCACDNNQYNLRLSLDKYKFYELNYSQNLYSVTNIFRKQSGRR